jgi:hypothetical protein
MVSPRASVIAQSGAVGQRAAAAVTEAHSKDKR